MHTYIIPFFYHLKILYSSLILPNTYIFIFSFKPLASDSCTLWLKKHQGCLKYTPLHYIKKAVVQVANTPAICRNAVHLADVNTTGDIIF